MCRTAIAIVLVVTLAGCKEGEESADKRQAENTRLALAEADRQIGMPDITNYTERKLARDILELRDKEITTYVYIVNLYGDLVYLGEAIGFGLPYSVQYTNPQRRDGLLSNPITMPQADPNGLFMPEGLSATWIMLKGPDGNIHPVYVEPNIIVSPFPLEVKPVERRPNAQTTEKG